VVAAKIVTGKIAKKIEPKPESAAECWRGIRMTEFERHQLKAIRDELDRAHAERTAPVANATVAASATRLSGKYDLTAEAALAEIEKDNDKAA
jgi:hypothetical protein